MSIKKKKTAAKKAAKPKKPASKPARKTTSKAVLKPKPIKKAAPKAAKKATKKTTSKPAKKVTAKPAKKVAAKPAKKASAPKAPKKVAAKKVAAKPVKKVTAKPGRTRTAPAAEKTRSLLHAVQTTEIVMTGILAIDTDGTGPAHNDDAHQDETSAKVTADGKFVFKSDPTGVRFLNADVDEYSVAPGNLANVRGGPLSVGDLATVVLANGTTRSVPIGDFGPDHKAGEFSLAAVQAMGVDVRFTHIGPIPTLDGPAATDIPVTVTFRPGSAS